METHIHGGDIYSRSFELDYSVNINPLGIPRAVKKRQKRVWPYQSTSRTCRAGH